MAIHTRGIQPCKAAESEEETVFQVCTRSSREAAETRAHKPATGQFKAAMETVGKLRKTNHQQTPPPSPVQRTNLHCTIFTKHIIKHNRVFITDCQEIPPHLHSNLICHTEAHAPTKSSCICSPPHTFSPTHALRETCTRAHTHLACSCARFFF